MIKKHKSHILDKLFALMLIASIVGVTLSIATKASAATLSNMWAVETNMDASGSGQLWIAFKANAADTAGSWTIALSGTGAAVAATQTVTTTGCTSTFSFLTGVTPLPGTLTASGSGSTITISSVGALTSGTYYCVAFTGSAVTNPSSAGVYSYTITGTAESGTNYYSVLSSATNNSISVTATVPQSFTLSLSGNTDSLGTLSPSSVATSTGVNATVSTNAASGLGLWAFDSNAGLYSPTAVHTIASTSPNATTLQTLTAGTEGYLTNAAYQSDTSGTAPTTTTPFTGAAGTGDGLNTTPAEIASGTGPVNAAIIKVKESAAISSTTPDATDYADTVTIVGAGSF